MPDEAEDSVIEIEETRQRLAAGIESAKKLVETYRHLLSPHPPELDQAT